MMTCEHIQTQFLNYLYELLDTEEHRAIESHLATCPGCQAALAAARRKQQLIATAAKKSFPRVQFNVPNATTVLEKPAPEARRSWGMRQWALAAAVLLACGVSIPAIWLAGRELSLRAAIEKDSDAIASLQTKQASLVAELQQEDARTEAKLKETEESLKKLREGQLAKWNEKVQDILTQKIQVAVAGPEILLPGAQNEFQIHTSNLENKPQAARLSARLVDQDKKTLFEVKEVASTGVYRLQLPADLPVTANRQFALEIDAHRPDKPDRPVQHKLPLASTSYFTHLATDKPMYRPGETVRFRSLTLGRFTLKPVQDQVRLHFTITNPQGAEIFALDGDSRLKNQDGKVVNGPDGKPLPGIGAGDFVLQPDLPGGEYTLKVQEASNLFIPQERKFLVNQFQNPRFNKELDFTRKSYGPGQEVVAACSASKAEGGALANKPVTAFITIDGKPFKADGQPGSAPLNLQTDAAGKVTVRFKLPAAIERGYGSLSVQFSDGGNVETLVRTIPIALKKLQIDFFPEGGDLVAGVSNRVYFQVRTTLDKPAELKGRIVDDQGRAVETVATLHDDKKPGVNQGLGSFNFTPAGNRTYQLKIDEPADIEGVYRLPEVKGEGVVLTATAASKDATQNIQAQVNSVGKDRNLLVGLYCRGKLLDQQAVAVPKNQFKVVPLTVPGGIGGVMRVTVFEETPAAATALTARAERLLYRRPDNALDLKVKPDRDSYAPGDKAKLTLSASNDKKEAAPGVALVAVVDKSVLTLADEKTFKTMPTHFYLGTEIRRPEDLEFGDFLVSADPEAEKALDMLLGTQGWRRFAEQNPQDFQKNQKADAGRILMARNAGDATPVGLAAPDAIQLVREVGAQALPIYEEQQKLAQALVDMHKPDGPTQKQLAAIPQEIENARLLAMKEAASQEQHRGITAILAPWLLTGGGILALLGIVLGAISLLRKLSGLARPALVLAFGACTVALVAGLFYFDSQGLHPAQPEVVLAKAPGKPRVKMREMMLAKQAVPPTGAEADLDKALARYKAQMDLYAESRRATALDDLRGAKLEVDRARLLNLVIEARRVQDADAQLPAKQLNALGFYPPANALVVKQPAGFAAVANAPLAARLKVGPQNMERGFPEFLQVPQGLRQGGPGPAAFGGRRQEAEAPLGGRLRNRGFADAIDRKDAFIGEANRRLVRPREEIALAWTAWQQQSQKAGLGASEISHPPQDILAGNVILLDTRPAAPHVPMVVREYAHVRPAALPTGERSDFTDTVYWHPALVLPGGPIDVNFQLSDAVTSYQVLVMAHTADGRLGSSKTEIEAKLPFSIDAKVPVEITAGDRIDLPVSVANNTAQMQKVDLQLSAANLRVAQLKSQAELNLPADGRGRAMFPVSPAVIEGTAEVKLEGSAGSFHDRVVRKMTVVPFGFPVEESRSDFLSGNSRFQIPLPESWLPGTLRCQVVAYPSTLAALQKGLEGMLREPYGCFEQTSTTNYPNLLVLDYLRETNQARPEIEQRTRALLANGYTKLTSFECYEKAPTNRKGYEWFGGTAAPHEALTAYGLMQFRDMSRVHNVDATMVERTKAYLMAQKDGKGGFKRNPRGLDSFGHAPEEVTNAYIVWALTESSKDDDVEKELATLRDKAAASKDPYLKALVALSLLNRSRNADAVALLATIAAAQNADGHVDAGQTSITGSGGRDLQIETTALALLGWLKANQPGQFTMPVQKAVRWIGQQRRGSGTFGSTQSTILSLKALIAHARANKKTAEAGELRLAVGGKQAASLPFRAGVEDALVLDIADAEKILKPGKNELDLGITGKNAFPYTVAWSYRTEKPVSSEGCPVQIKTALDRQAVEEGQPVHLTITVENAQDKGQGMAVAIVGLPAGLTLPEDLKQLKDHARLREDGTKPGLVSAWETRGRELILYWRDLAPRQKIEVPIDLVARVPGSYSGPASRAYLYYNADKKCWTDPLKVSIEVKK